MRRWYLMVSKKHRCDYQNSKWSDVKMVSSAYSRNFHKIFPSIHITVWPPRFISIHSFLSHNFQEPNHQHPRIKPAIYTGIHVLRHDPVTAAAFYAFTYTSQPKGMKASTPPWASHHPPLRPLPAYLIACLYIRIHGVYFECLAAYTNSTRPPLCLPLTTGSSAPFPPSAGSTLPLNVLSGGVVACGRASDQLFCLSDKRETRSTYPMQLPRMHTNASTCSRWNAAFELVCLCNKYVKMCVRPFFSVCPHKMISREM